MCPTSHGHPDAQALFHGCSMSTLSASSAWQIMVPTFRDVTLKFVIFDTNTSFPMTTMSFKYCVTSQQDEGLKILIRRGSPRPNLACPGDTDQIATAQKQIASTKTYSTTNHQCHKTKDLAYPIWTLTKRKTHIRKPFLIPWYWCIGIPLLDENDSHPILGYNPKLTIQQHWKHKALDVSYKRYRGANVDSIHRDALRCVVLLEKW